MGFSWSRKTSTPIAVDFGSDSVKVLQLLPEDPPQLAAAAAIAIPDHLRRDADAHQQFLTQELRRVIREAGFTGRRVVASISAAHTYVQHVRLAKTEGVPVLAQIETELRGRLPLDPAAMVIRHVTVGDVFADGAAKQEVICLAASREVVMRSIHIVRQAGLDVVGMHCEPMAILEAFAHLFRRADDVNRTSLFVDIGGATTKALIAHGRQLVFAKTIHVGGDHFIRQLAAHAGVPLEEARRLHIGGSGALPSPLAAPNDPAPVTTERRRGGTIPGMATLGDAEAAPSAPVAAPVAARPAGAVAVETGEMLDCLIDELQLCIGYHAAMFHERPIEKIVFLGGESRQIATCQQIARALRLPAQLGDPLVRVVRHKATPPPASVDLRQPQPGWAVPMGLCLLPTNL